MLISTSSSTRTRLVLGFSADIVISFLTSAKIMCEITSRRSISKDILCTCAMFAGPVVPPKYLCRHTGEGFIERRSITDTNGSVSENVQWIVLNISSSSMSADIILLMCYFLPFSCEHLLLSCIFIFYNSN